MEVVETLHDLFQARARLPEPLGFVPTMGYLHEGHLSLARRARQECAGVAASIFVNPTQFGPNEDLARYPRDLGRDLALLEGAGVDLVWTPTADEMYPPGFQTWVDVTEVTQPLEGGMRPGHFRGVTTVVAKLFNAVRPQRAYFGQKDAQQAVTIRQMARDLSYPIEIVVCPIVREPDGLALSSRNVYLSPQERQAAPVLSHALRLAAERFAAGERDTETLRRLVADTIAAEPLAALQYASCSNPDTLAELHGEIQGRALLSLAAYFGKTRLIDNWLLS